MSWQEVILRSASLPCVVLALNTCLLDDYPSQVLKLGHLLILLGLKPREDITLTVPMANQFVGRQAELLELVHGFCEASSGRRCVSIVEGEPGIGKTRLTQEFAVYATRLGARVIWGRVRRPADSPSRHGWLDLMTSSVTDDTGVSADYMALPLFEGDEENDITHDFSSPKSGANGHWKFEEAGTFLKREGATQTPVVILDDLLADSVSLGILTDLLAVLSDGGHLIATFRDSGGDWRSRLANSVSALGVSVKRLCLEALSEADARQLIAADGIPLRKETILDRLYCAAGGNPLLLNQLARMLRVQVDAQALSEDASVAGGEPTSRRPDDWIFMREGDYWTATFQRRVVHLRHTKGALYLAHLLHHPGQEFHALQLSLLTEPSPATENDASANTYSFSDGLSSDLALSDAGPFIDGHARTAYTQRLKELEEDYEEAQNNHDLGRVYELSRERGMLQQQLAVSVGLGGRDRRACSHGERARVRVTHAIKSLIRHTKDAHPSLSAYLAVTIRTGTFCSYTPLATASTWRVLTQNPGTRTAIS
jgi:AAA ATPase domain